MASTVTTKSPVGNIGAIYARYSSKFQHSIEDQIRVCREWAEKNGITVPDELIFTDRAVTGKSCRRKGLKAFQKALAENKATVAILFTTNRLYRKFYQSLAFVEEEIVDKGKRAVFVKSAIDTDDKEHWRKLLHIHALMDEFVIQTIAAHVQSAHEGLLLQCRVCGTIAFGFTGEVIPGQMTRMNKAARRLVVDPIAAEWVKKVFDWFVGEHATIREIVRRLNAANAPLPPRTHLKRWTRIAVRRLLSNPRYRGWWEYGRTEAIWVNKPGYTRQVRRNEPLAGIQIDALRILDDATWYAAQERLEKLAQGAGRKPADGDRQSRPRVINGLVICGKHEQALHSHGPFGKYMSCKDCREAPEPDLYSLLPRQLALELVCDSISGAILADEPFLELAADAFLHHVESLTQPDQGQAEGLSREIDRLTKQINFILGSPGKTEQDERENREHLSRFRADRAHQQKLLAEIEAALQSPTKVPEREEIMAFLQQMKTLLRESARSDDPVELAALRDLIREVTDGMIVATQQGEKKSHRGWVRLTFKVRVLDAVARRFGFPEVHGEATVIEIDVLKPDPKDELCERVKDLYDANLPNNEIAAELNLNRNTVTELLTQWSEKHQQPLQTGRKRWRGRRNTKKAPATYMAIADDAMALWNDPADLSVLEIARRLKTHDTMVWKALAHWCRNRGLPPPSAKDRRERTMARAMRMYNENLQIKDIAATLGYTKEGMNKLLSKCFERDGKKMPDGRSRRHHCKPRNDGSAAADPRQSEERPGPVLSDSSPPSSLRA